MTPSGIEQATFRFVAQRLSHCATAVTRNILILNCEIVWEHNTYLVDLDAAAKVLLKCVLKILCV